MAPSRLHMLFPPTERHINPKAFERLNISKSDQSMLSGTAYYLPLTKGNADAISKFPNVAEVTPVIARTG